MLTLQVLKGKKVTKPLRLQLGPLWELEERECVHLEASRERKGAFLLGERGESVCAPTFLHFEL